MARSSLASFSTSVWLKNWAGAWSLLTCSYFGQQYTQTTREVLGVALKRCFFISRRGQSAAYFDQRELRDFSMVLVRKVAADRRLPLQFCRSLKREAAAVTRIIGRLAGAAITPQDYDRFLAAFYAYVSPHVAVKRTVDFLPPELLDRLLPSYEAARRYASRSTRRRKRSCAGSRRRSGGRPGTPSG